MVDTSRRDDFFDFDGWAYVNCAYQGPMPRVSAAAVEEALELKRRPHLLDEKLIMGLPERVRPVAARFIGASADEITIGTGTSHGLNLAAAGLPLRPGDEVLLAPGEFPSNRFPWLHHARRRGYTVRTVPMAGEFPAVEDYEHAATPRTRAVTAAFVNYSTGYRMDLPALSRLCQERGWYLVVDACQAAGGVAFQVDDFQPDILATGGYKWLLAPYGTGFTYIRRDLIEELEVQVVNWMGLENAADFNALSTQRMAFAHGARRFDVPETASFLNLYGLERSMEYLLEVGVETVERHSLALLDRLLDGLPDGFQVMSDTRAAHRSGVLLFAAPDPEATAAVHRRLLEARVHVSMRENRIRVSPHLYNDEPDIDRLLACL